MVRPAPMFRRYLCITLVTALLTAASYEFYNITWGTGKWLGEFSLKWGMAFFIFESFAILCLQTIILILWQNHTVSVTFARLAQIRTRLGEMRWGVVIVLLSAPIWLFQYTPWGLVIHDSNLRLFIWLVIATLLAYLFTSSPTVAFEWRGILSAFVVLSAVTVAAAELSSALSYPFSLGWSEGNRWWDYSILFGRSIYIYPADKNIPVLLDKGRQFIGGIPFLLPDINIWQARLWASLVNFIPYFILGLVALRSKKTSTVLWVLAALWAMMFVMQGPIHSPLLLCAVFTVFAWQKPLGLAVPIIFFTGYFAHESRFTWLFAPGMWIGMLELCSTYLHTNTINRTAWVRTIVLGVAGFSGGYLAPFFLPSIMAQLTALFTGAETPSAAVAGDGVTLSGISSSVSVQTLLWYRLLPNDTYPPGILLGLIYAVAPLIALLFYLYSSRRWALNGWQKLAIWSTLIAFFVVGLIVSVKIGGGGDLHNMDMFIIGLLFTAAVAWHNGGSEWLQHSQTAPAWVKIMLILAVAIPAYHPMRFLRPATIAEADMTWVMTLADIPPQGPFPEMLPYKEDAAKALHDIQQAVKDAAPHGDILFIDQRQLLTFGYIADIPLVPEYDKKVLINEAMSADEKYFAAFYRDLAEQRFSLIITNPLHERVQTEEDNFGEENNAWVEWVSTPVLCFYEPLDTLRKVKVQLLVPKKDISACAQYLSE